MLFGVAKMRPLLQREREKKKEREREKERKKERETGVLVESALSKAEGSRAEQCSARPHNERR
jgi:hypothetical protein